ncbi:zinc-binding dehydrogenase [Streptomyces aidingensis]|uniref:NADPH:quinone reductase n=1 Tax=Streptomyces aidingensis TaxID=910347 RepID=A0A1I1HQW4_9ACTN|nr:zinc-binding dehydrogenase [Streptomyces aidingensis]SFC24358.1 NADPH:quinone reductase [Streptomyces aidingensis]
MRAIRLHSFGPPENLVPENLPDPVPGAGEVLIEVAAAGVHLVDTVLRRGAPGGRFPRPDLPTVPGREVAGTVTALGPETDPEWLGARVAAHLGMVPGGYADRAVTAAGRLHRLPAELPFDRAVAMIGTGRTTMGVLRAAEPGPGPGDLVLVLAAAGGIGSLLVQYARHRGATVVGAAGGPHKTAAVAGLGATAAVDYNRPGWPEEVRRMFGDRPATLLLEGVGGPLARDAAGLLAPGGRHLRYGWASVPGFDGSADPAAMGEAELRERSITAETVLGPAMLDNLRALEERAMALAADGTLRPPVHRFPLADAARAHRALETRATVGKVVLIP